MNRLVVLGGVVVVAIYVLLSSLFVLDQREQAIVTRFGEITRTYSEPGIYFKVPTSIVEDVQVVEKRLLRSDLEDIRVQVSGGQFYVVDAFLTFQIDDLQRFRESVSGSLALAQQRINPQFKAALLQVYGKREFGAALSEQRTAMMFEARDLIKLEMAKLGIDVIDVRILRTDLEADVSAQTFERMKAERLAIAALTRARGQELAQTLRAVADRQAVEFVAAAGRDSNILRGEGDASRNGIFADAFTMDPEFFEFYRSMQAYQTALDRDSTTLLLNSESDFFGYFGQDTKTAPDVTQPDGASPNSQ